MRGLRLVALSCVSAAALVAGCADPEGSLSGERWDVERVAAMPKPDDERLGALFDGYVGLARAELKEFDWADGAEFAAKAEMASGGALPAPFATGERDISELRLPELAAAEAEMLAVLGTRGAQLRAPVEIAEVQLAWDCWLQESEEDHQTEEIGICRDDFDDAMARAREKAQLPPQLVVILPEDDGSIGGVVVSSDGSEGVLLNQPYAAASGRGEQVRVEQGEIEAAFAGALDAQPIPPSYFTVLFDFNSARLDDAADAVVAAVVEDIRKRPAAEVVVVGHSDAPGASGANLQISRMRAASVRRAILGALGPTGDAAFEITGQGERRLAVDTQQREEQNRRVEVTVR